MSSAACDDGHEPVWIESQTYDAGFLVLLPHPWWLANRYSRLVRSRRPPISLAHATQTLARPDPGRPWCRKLEATP